MDCSTVLPVSSFYSTNLNNKICSYDRLAQRISRSLGAPLINIEVHQDQLYENIGIAVEMFTKFAGYTREYVIFDSSLYKRGAGIRLDVLFTANRTATTPLNPNFSYRYPDECGTSYAPLYGIGKMIIGEPTNPYIFEVGENLKPDQLYLNQEYDYLLDDYRKVIACRGFEVGSSDGVNTLFTI
ncbi:MAG: hypothetical protein V3W20_10005, partial [Candidatus Neomarinimicrobiota bacterium]